MSLVCTPCPVRRRRPCSAEDFVKVADNLFLGEKQFKVQLHADSFHSYRCDAPPPETTVTKDELINMYRTMVRGFLFWVGK